MFLFIFDNIGIEKLLFVGIIALIFLGPRKLPEYARKIGKIMAEFRNTTNEFKETWQREANFEEEAKAFDLKTLEAETVNRVGAESGDETGATLDAPAIKEIDAASFEHLKTAETKPPKSLEKTPIPDDINDKKNWL